MFAQIIQGKTSGRQAVRASLDNWMKDLEPDAKGYLGTTADVTDQGDFFALVRFEWEEVAKANSERPEQVTWWADFEKTLDGRGNIPGQQHRNPHGRRRSRFSRIRAGHEWSMERSRPLHFRSPVN